MRSAARDTEMERENTPPARQAEMRIAAGSAARAAEEAKRLGGGTHHASAGFSLRAKDGAVFRNAPLVSSRQDNCVEEDELPQTHASAEERSAHSREVDLRVADDRGPAELSVPGPLRAAAARVQSLFRKITSSSVKPV